MRWSGTDGSGSGIASYRVFVSDDGGAFMSWLTDTTQTSAIYPGADGHTYGFYSIATDNVGNVQPTPTSAQAMTTVDATPPTSRVTALPSFSPGSFTVRWSGTDNSGSGIASYSVFVSDNGETFQPLDPYTPLRYHLYRRERPHLRFLQHRHRQCRQRTANAQRCSGDDDGGHHPADQQRHCAYPTVSPSTLWSLGLAG